MTLDAGGFWSQPHSKLNISKEKTGGWASSRPAWSPSYDMTVSKGRIHRLDLDFVFSFLSFLRHVSQTGFDLKDHHKLPEELPLEGSPCWVWRVNPELLHRWSRHASNWASPLPISFPYWGARACELTHYSPRLHSLPSFCWPVVPVPRFAVSGTTTQDLAQLPWGNSSPFL